LLVDRRRKGDPTAVTPPDLPAPPSGNKIYYDADLKGFGCRVTAKGARAFVLNYRTRNGRERRHTIGSWPDWSVSAARMEAGDLKKRIDRGEDPMAEVEADRTAKTVADLCDRYIETHLPRKRESSQKTDRRLIEKHIRPAMKNLKVADVRFKDVDGLHQAMTRDGTPWQANRTIALLSKMFSLAIKWEWRSQGDGNPCKGVERNPEPKRKRYLSPSEIRALSEALAAERDQQAANIVRLLLLTGARSGEVRGMRWTYFDAEEGMWAGVDLETGKWTKASAHTKQKEWHEVQLPPPALLLLSELRKTADRDAVFVFPDRNGDGCRAEVKDAWRRLCIAAGIVTTESIKDAKGRERTIIKPSARLHDLRHTTASILVSGGRTLEIIGAPYSAIRSRPRLRATPISTTTRLSPQPSI
jgi:integrase